MKWNGFFIEMEKDKGQFRFDNEPLGIVQTSEWKFNLASNENSNRGKF